MKNAFLILMSLVLVVGCYDTDCVLTNCNDQGCEDTKAINYNYQYGDPSYGGCKYCSETLAWTFYNGPSYLDSSYESQGYDLDSLLYGYYSNLSGGCCFIDGAVNQNFGTVKLWEALYINTEDSTYCIFE